MPFEDKILFAKIFSGPQNILEILHIVTPDIEEHKPCFDFDRQPVDASIATLKKNTFCLSAFNIRRKVIESEIPAQTMALAIHEYSEVIGLNEEEAVALQTRVLIELK